MGQMDPFAIVARARDQAGIKHTAEIGPEIGSHAAEAASKSPKNGGISSGGAYLGASSYLGSRRSRCHPGAEGENAEMLVAASKRRATACQLDAGVEGVIDDSGRFRFEGSSVERSQSLASAARGRPRPRGRGRWRAIRRSRARSRR